MTENIVGGCALLSLFLPCNSASRNRLRPRNFLRLIQQRIHPFEESHCMRQSRMHLKRHLIHPPRMNEKQPPVPRPPERVKTQAARLLRVGPATSRKASSTVLSSPSRACSRTKVYCSIATSIPPSSPRHVWSSLIWLPRNRPLPRQRTNPD